MLIILGIIFLVVFIFIDYRLATAFEKIAFDKGYDQSAHTFAMCFWLGLIGYIYVAALPTRTPNEIQQKEPASQKTTNEPIFEAPVIDDIDDEEFKNNDKIYGKALEAMQKGKQHNSAEYYSEAIKLFNTIPQHKNATQLCALCEIKLRQAKE